MYASQAALLNRRHYHDSPNLVAKITGEKELLLQEEHDEWERKCASLSLAGFTTLRPPGVAKTLQMLSEERPASGEVNSTNASAIRLPEIARSPGGSFTDNGSEWIDESTGALSREQSSAASSNLTRNRSEDIYNDDEYVERGFTG